MLTDLKKNFPDWKMTQNFPWFSRLRRNLVVQGAKTTQSKAVAALATL